MSDRAFSFEQLAVALATAGAGLILIGLRLTRAGINTAERVITR